MTDNEPAGDPPEELKVPEVFKKCFKQPNQIFYGDVVAAVKEPKSGDDGVALFKFYNINIMWRMHVCHIIQMRQLVYLTPKKIDLSTPKKIDLALVVKGSDNQVGQVLVGLIVLIVQGLMAVMGP